MFCLTIPFVQYFLNFFRLVDNLFEFFSLSYENFVDDLHLWGVALVQGLLHSRQEGGLHQLYKHNKESIFIFEYFPCSVFYP